jgi:hypothetical protein
MRKQRWAGENIELPARQGLMTGKLMWEPFEDAAIVEAGLKATGRS